MFEGIPSYLDMSVEIGTRGGGVVYSFRTCNNIMIVRTFECVCLASSKLGESPFLIDP